MKKYIPIKENSMKISADTQNTIRKYIRDKKYISQSGILKVSFQDKVILIIMLQDEFNRTKDLKIRRAINELKDKRFEE